MWYVPNNFNRLESISENFNMLSFDHNLPFLMPKTTTLIFCYIKE